MPRWTQCFGWSTRIREAPPLVQEKKRALPGEMKTMPRSIHRERYEALMARRGKVGWSLVDKVGSVRERRAKWGFGRGRGREDNPEGNRGGEYDPF